MPSKNNLSALKTKPRNTLKVASEATTVTHKGRAGRPAKAKAAKESFTIPLRLTEAEGAQLAEKAGHVPLATFVKIFLREKTDLLK